MKTRLPHQTAVRFRTGGQFGMTLVEVVVSLAIAGLIIGGIVSGYTFCLASTEKAELAQVANAKALERLEETQSATWDTASYPVVDQLVATNFPDQNILLNITGSGPSGAPATLKTAISQISLAPPLREIRVDCIWQFRGAGMTTNTIETIRAPDQ